MTTGRDRTPALLPATRRLASYAAQMRSADMPDAILAEASRAFVNWMGCVLGGCREDSARIAASVASAAAAGGGATMIGHGLAADMAGAALVNCLSSSALAFDDTHLATVTHPTGPVAAALFAWAEQRPVRGVDFLAALAIGIELQCRLANMLLLPPADANLGIYVTGVVGPVGVAAAVGRLMTLEEDRMISALGLAAAQSGGFRATHGSMAGSLVPAFGARDGLYAAFLAKNGFTCSPNALEGPKGFAEMFASGADPAVSLAGLGERYELLENAYKPYPCGIVIHAAIDAALEARRQYPAAAPIAAIDVVVHPLALALTDRPAPRDALEGQVSLHHWVAAALLRGHAGVLEARREAIDDRGIAALRALVRPRTDPDYARDEAGISVTLADGSVYAAHVPHARGSRARPLSDDELDRKFLMQAALVMPRDGTERLLRRCRDLLYVDDVAATLREALLETSPS